MNSDKWTELGEYLDEQWENPERRKLLRECMMETIIRLRKENTLIHDVLNLRQYDFNHELLDLHERYIKVSDVISLLSNKD